MIIRSTGPRIAAIALCFFTLPLFPAASDPAPLRDPATREIAVYAADHEPALRKQGAEIWNRGAGFIVAGSPAGALDALDALGVKALYRVADQGEGIHILSHDEFFQPPLLPGFKQFTINGHAVLYLIPAGIEMQLPGLKFHGMFHGVARAPLAPVQPHALDQAGAPPLPLAPNPLVQQILNATSQASWYTFVREISGDLPVTIPGTTPACTVAGNCRVLTRYSDAMFPTPNANGKAFATEYLLDRGAGWGYSGIRESYTSTNSGCTSAQGARVWQNVIFTIPGQIDWGQHQQVLFVTHYDTISYNATENQNYAPGADDAMSGGSALLEAMKVFKDYAFGNTLKVIYFSGEEVGLCGSYAYTNQHPAADMYRVVNMDQTAYDGNRDKIMNLFNWDTANCPGCVAFGDQYVQANADYGAPIGAGKLVRQTFMMCQTDHCPFWEVGVTAIDLNENFNEIHPCFDQGQSATCHDDVVSMDPNHPGQLLFDATYSWPTEKIAIATVATAANPLYACPGAGATLTATAQSTQATLSWGAVSPVTNYLIERAPGGCGGAFAGVGSVTGTGFVDTGLTNNTTYGYRIRTCPTQVSNCIALTPQACTAPGTPTIGTATVPGNNQINLTWSNGAPASAKFNVYRAMGTCAAPGPYTRIATGVAASPYLDATVSGGTTYAFQVAGTEATGLCESPKTACVQATATGTCTLAPTFAGATSASNNSSATCGVTLNWSAGASNCGGPTPTYTVFRSTTGGFTPSGANQIASGLTGSSYNDTGSLSNGVTYYYIVRATDNLGNSDANLAQRSTAPTGAVTTLLNDTFEAAGGHDVAGWTTAVGTGSNAWAWNTSRNHSPTHSWYDADIGSTSDAMMMSPAITPSANSVLTFWHTYAMESNYDGGTLETAPSPFTTWTVVPDAAFTAGVFNGTLNTGSNPIGGKRAWTSGTLGAMTQVSVNLGAFSGQNIKLRWHEGNDPSVVAGGTAPGWYVDDINVSGTAACTPACSATPMSSNVLHGKSGSNLVENWAAVAGAVTYNVYRNPSTNVGTWSGPAVAPGLVGLTWTDSNQLGNATSQFYSVTDVNGCGAESSK